jgi:glycine/D-amino acid oxidase-like deaminating enzyme
MSSSKSSIPSIAVLGSGIAGLTAAYHLVKAGFTPTIIGLKGGAEQASRAAQGVLCNKGLFFYESPLFQAKIESLPLMKQFLDDLERVSGRSIPRFFNGVNEPYWTAEDFQATVTRVYRHKFWGAHGTEDRAGWPAFSESSKLPLGYLHYPIDGWFDPSAVLDALEAYLRDRGISFVEEKVLGFELTGDDKVFLRTKERQLSNSFDQIILATGAGTQALWEELDVKSEKMFLIGGQTLRFKRDKADEPRIFVKGNQSLALLPKEIIVGSTSWKGFESESLDRDAAELLQKTEESFGFKLMGERESRQGVRMRFKDRMPLVGWLSSGKYARKVYILSGFYKNGMHLAELCAQEMLLDIVGKGDERRYKGFSPLRFSV